MQAYSPYVLTDSSILANLRSVGHTFPSYVASIFLACLEVFEAIVCHIHISTAFCSEEICSAFSGTVVDAAFCIHEGRTGGSRTWIVGAINLVRASALSVGCS